jgi:peroxiredoxin
MRKYLLALIIPGLSVSLLWMSSCRDQGSFTVEGTFSIPDSTPVELLLLTEDKAVQTDSVFSRKGEFGLKGSIEYPQLFVVKFFNAQNIYLVIYPGDRITLSIDNSLSEIAYYVGNSPDSKLIKELVDKQNLVLKQIDALSGEWELNRADTSDRRLIDVRYQNLMKNHRDFPRRFIREHPHSPAIILALYQNFGRKAQPLFDRYDDLDIYNFADSALVPLFPETYAVKALNSEVTETKEQIARNKYIEKAVIEGRALPRLEYIALNGDTITYDGTRKRPVVLIFWASWNKYSVDELLALNAYKQSPGAGNIDIISLSLDTSPEKLREFIDSNQLMLPVICDYHYWDSDIPGRYAIKQIPSTLITNREGIVIARNLFSDELMNQINEIAR